jgi:hypothetical protein
LSKKIHFVCCEALLLFGSGLNHDLILSRNHFSCGDPRIHRLINLSWIRKSVAPLSPFHFFIILVFSPFPPKLFIFSFRRLRGTHHLVSELRFKSGVIYPFNLFYFCCSTSKFEEKISKKKGEKNTKKN